MSINNNFIKALKLLITYNNQISDNNKKIKEIKNKKDNLEKQIISYIEKNNLTQTQLNLEGNNILYNINQSTIPLSQKIVKESLLEYLKNENEVNNIFEIIKKKRNSERKNNISLKIKVNKQV